MSNSKRHLLYACGVMMLVMLVGGALIVWPRYREASELTAERIDLRDKMNNISLHTDALEQLTDDVARIRQIVSEDLKDIPPSPGVHELMNRLSLPVDDQTVVEQTFSAGQSVPAVRGDESLTLMAMPLTIDMQSRFDAVYAMLRTAENMRRLVRVNTVRLSIPKEQREQDRNDGSPIVEAEIGLEAVFDPPQSAEEGSL